ALEDRTGAGLEWQMDVFAERGEFDVRVDHVLPHVFWMGARVPDPVDAVHRVNPSQQVGETDPRFLREVPSVTVHVLAEQGHLTAPVGGQAGCLRDQFPGVPALFPASCRGNDAVGTDAVASLGYLKPALKLTGPVGGKTPGEIFELEVTLGGQRVGVEEL